MVIFFISIQPRDLCARSPSNRIERFFDRDKNKQIDWYEQQLIITHSIQKWELADSKKKKEFDYNQDMMLTPYEYQKYLESRRSRRPLSL